MSRRRSRKLDLEELLVAGAVVVVLVAAAHFTGWLLATGLVGVVSYAAGARRRPRGRPVRRARQSAERAGPGRVPAAVSRPARGAVRGAEPPRGLVAVGRLCADGEHEWCEQAGCGCRCGHPGIRARQVPPLPAELDEPPF